MRISFVTDSIYPFNFGGKEKRLHDLSIALSRLGNDVHIYTMKWWHVQERQISLNGVTFHALCSSTTLYGRENRRIWPALKFAVSCVKMIRQPWDIVDVDQMPFFPLFTMWIVAKVRRKKLFATWHEALDLRDWVKYMGITGVIASAIENLAILVPDGIGAASHHTFERIRSKRWVKTAVQLVGTGLDLEAISKAKPVNEQIDVVYVGRLVKGKNVNLLIEAIQVVLAYKPLTKCHIYGTGVEHKKLADQIKTLGLQGSVFLKGSLSEADQIYSSIKSASVLVLPSEREGFGIVAAEALACGTPVVTVQAANNAAMALVNPGFNGSIVALEKSALAQAMLHWMGMNQKIQDPDIDKKYSWDSIAQRQIRLYQS